ncbi:hypothetical protein O181_007046 [Austropuccinia psidii MF-1]|uniref:Uncharacterized protein n=1 Tax=Austropuccinia psidii MF-1 TaxID=1389203 RepID=A0A9Q3BM20_9BASI|nr:hypothetical protein [Austropuccinia psidii MF-1]
MLIFVHEMRLLPPCHHPHPPLCFYTSAAYHAHAPAVPSTLPPHFHPNPSLHSCRALKICLWRCHPISALTTHYASTPPPLTILTLLQCPQDMPLMPPSHLSPHPCHLPCLCCCIRAIGYGGLLIYMMNPITEIC